MIQRKMDLHVHTDNSPDGNHSPMFLCEQAEFAGLRAIAFTDHCEVDVYKQAQYDKRVKQAFFEATKAQSAFRGKLIVLRGIELGQGHYDKETADAILARRNYDIVLGSVHHLRGQPDFCKTTSITPQAAHEQLTAYFDEILQMLEWGHFDVVAHLTYPLRYFFSASGILVDLKDYQPQMDAILKCMAEQGKALEVNSAGLRQPIGKLSPDYDIIRRFKELGGVYVTYGSDAHSAEDVGKGMEEACEAIRAAGFTEWTIFQSREPLKLPID